MDSLNLNDFRVHYAGGGPGNQPLHPVIPPGNKRGLKVEFPTKKKRKFYMKKSRFSESQIIAILKQVEAGTPVSSAK